MSTLFHNILRAVASAMEILLVICLLLLAFSVFSLGWWLAELLGAGQGPRSIDVQVTRLRKKIERDSKNPRYLQTVRGKGYMLLTE